jgi:hypothetical protein
MVPAARPRDTSRSIPPSGLDALALAPPGDVLYEGVDRRFLTSPPTGAYESGITGALPRATGFN